MSRRPMWRARLMVAGAIAVTAIILAILQALDVI
jgi:hypothetical protein